MRATANKIINRLKKQIKLVEKKKGTIKKKSVKKKVKRRAKKRRR